MSTASTWSPRASGKAQAAQQRPNAKGALPRPAFELERFEQSEECLVTAPTETIIQKEPGGVLSPQDRLMARLGHTGLQFCLERTVVPSIFKQALSEMLETFPWLSGRLCLNKAGELDVDCCNKGALLGVASTATTLEQLLAATEPDPETCALAGLKCPWQHKLLSGDAAVSVEHQHPILLALLTQLAGGGSLVLVAAQHVMGDFGCLQLLMAHWCTAYNVLLHQQAKQGQQQQQQQPLQPGLQPQPSSAAACCEAVAEEEPGTGGGATKPSDSTAGSLCIEAVAHASTAAAPQPIATALATALDAAGGALRAPTVLPPPIVNGEWAKPYEDAGAAKKAGIKFKPLFIPRGWLFVPRIMFNVKYHLLRRGGGARNCFVRIPAARLAELKQQANQELAELVGKGGGSAAGGGGQGKGAEGGAEWVSTHDALCARLLQVLHSLPNRRGRPMLAFAVVNMRPRLSPPLPLNHLHNIVQWCPFAVPAKEVSLGGIARIIRTTVARESVPSFQTHLAQTRTLQARHGALAMTNRMASSIDPRVTAFSPEGGIAFNQWPMPYEAFAFGGQPPLRAFVVFAVAPSSLLHMCTEPDGSVTAGVWLHNSTWAMLDDMYGGLRL